LQSTEQEAVINPGDYLVGDLNGVVCLPRHLAEKALALMGPQVEADRLVALDIQQGKSFLEASKEHRSVPGVKYDSPSLLE
jgi:regulator of RNase E activity RraA